MYQESTNDRKKSQDSEKSTSEFSAIMSGRKNFSSRAMNDDDDRFAVTNKRCIDSSKENESVERCSN